MTSTRAALVALALLAAVPARARAGDFWTRPEDPDAEVARRNYEREMQLGDDAAELASRPTTSGREIRRLLESAIRAYENASLARPDAPEPHYRAGLVLRNFFVACAQSTVICSKGKARPSMAEKMADHWTAFEKLAPLDPRVDFSFLFDRAIAHTHAAGGGGAKARAHIEAALLDYQAALQRVDLEKQNRKNVFGNMAETYMMLGRLDESIEMYEQTLRISGDPSTMYGLAVALDRDEQGAKSREIIRALGSATLDDFKASVQGGTSFFVPDGEVYYYLALAEEALGAPDEAIDDWQHFIDALPKSPFAERARANRDALLKANKHGRSKRPADDGVDRSYGR